MEDINGKIKYYIATCFFHYKNNYGDNYKNITRQCEYDNWFEEFIWNVTCDYVDGYDITKKYPIGEFFKYDTTTFEDVINHINDYYREVSGDDYILSDHSPINVIRQYNYVYVKRNIHIFYSLCKPDILEIL